MTASKSETISRPDIHAYHDYREYLRDYLEFFKKNSRQKVSNRTLSKDAGFSLSYLALVLTGRRNLTAAAQESLASVLKLSTSEKKFLEYLCILGDSEDEEERLQALAKIRKFKSYKDFNPNEFELYKYLTHWYYLAIREMTALPDFELDPKWIQERLKVRVPIKEIKYALEFLKDNGYIKVDSKGKVLKPDRHISCTGGVYRIYMARFHRQMFDMASDSIEDTPRDQRWLDANTFPVAEDDISEVQKILDDAMGKIVEIRNRKKRKTAKSVYHVSVAAFPITRDKG